MQVIKEYCDRCGKEITRDPLVHKIFPIKHVAPKGSISFRDKVHYSETTKMVCLDCLIDFWTWWRREDDSKEA